MKTCLEQEYWGTILEPDPGRGLNGKYLVVGPLPMRSGQAQPERATWVHPPVGPLLAGVTIWVQCIVDWAVAKGRGLGGPVPSC